MTWYGYRHGRRSFLGLQLHERLYRRSVQHRQYLHDARNRTPIPDHPTQFPIHDLLIIKIKKCLCNSLNRQIASHEVPTPQRYRRALKRILLLCTRTVSVLSQTSELLHYQRSFHLSLHPHPTHHAMPSTISIHRLDIPLSLSQPAPSDRVNRLLTALYFLPPPALIDTFPLS